MISKYNKLIIALLVCCLGVSNTAHAENLLGKTVSSVGVYANMNYAVVTYSTAGSNLDACTHPTSTSIAAIDFSYQHAN